jgi:hypothetical protein
MSPLPDIVRQYLEMTRVTAARIVYVLLDPQGRVTEWGGDVELLEPRHLTVGALAADQLVGLTGLVPVGRDSVVVPNLQLEPGLIVHLHAIPAPTGGCLLLLDAGPGYEEKWKKQQKTYDDKLAARAKRGKRG